MNEDIDVVPGENPIAVGTEEGGAKDHQVFSVPSFAFSSEFSLDPAGVCIEDVGLTRSSVFASREKQTAEKPLHGDKLISGAIVSSLEKKVSGSDDGEGSKVVASSGEQGDAGLATMMAEKLPKANSAVFFKTPAAVQSEVVVKNAAQPLSLARLAPHHRSYASDQPGALPRLAPFAGPVPCSTLPKSPASRASLFLNAIDGAGGQGSLLLLVQLSFCKPCMALVYLGKSDV
ncbi:hypothetical protein U1Q18_014566 [Sarracenia purpurea var. burkii]